MENSVTALILAGGRSNRFWPLGWSKPLVSFCGKSLLIHACERIVRTGIKKIVIVTNSYDVVEVENIKIPGISIQAIIQKESIGMADAVLSAKDIIFKSPTLVIGPDVVDLSLFDQIALMIAHKKEFIVGKQIETYFDGGYIKLDKEKVIGIVEKPGLGNEPSNFVNLVFNYFQNTGDFCNLLEQTKSEGDDIYEKALTAYVAKYPLELIPYKGFWYPIKYPWHTLDLVSYFLPQIEEYRAKTVQIKANVTIEGPVHLEEGVKIFENSKIVGPCYLGKNVVIGNNCLVRESQIGEGSVIGFNSDIARSYIGKNCWLHSNYVGDSVLSDNVSVGSGTVFANFRLDESTVSSLVNNHRFDTKRTKLGAMIGMNVRIGVQSSTMPGVKIGHDSFIGAGIVLEKDIPDESFCMLNLGNYTITKNLKNINNKNRDSFKKLL